jgi:hypothetical protein
MAPAASKLKIERPSGESDTFWTLPKAAFFHLG